MQAVFSFWATCEHSEKQALAGSPGLACGRARVGHSYNRGALRHAAAWAGGQAKGNPGRRGGRPLHRARQRGGAIAVVGQSVQKSIASADVGALVAAGRKALHARPDLQPAPSLSTHVPKGLCVNPPASHAGHQEMVWLQPPATCRSALARARWPRPCGSASSGSSAAACIQVGRGVSLTARERLRSSTASVQAPPRCTQRAASSKTQLAEQCASHTCRLLSAAPPAAPVCLHRLQVLKLRATAHRLCSAWHTAQRTAQDAECIATPGARLSRDYAVGLHSGSRAARHLCVRCSLPCARQHTVWWRTVLLVSTLPSTQQSTSTPRRQAPHWAALALLQRPHCWPQSQFGLFDVKGLALALWGAEVWGVRSCKVQNVTTRGMATKVVVPTNPGRGVPSGAKVPRLRNVITVALRYDTR